jgi:hypothetical protein
MAKPDKVAREAVEIKRLTDYVAVGKGVNLEGERMELEEILGKDIKLTDFVFLTSTKYEKESGKSEFAVIQFELEGTLYTTSTGGRVVVDALKQMPKNYLPVTIKIIKAKSKEGRRYYSIE